VTDRFPGESAEHRAARDRLLGAGWRWQVLDAAPEGPGTDWSPRREYD
jgi:hypothetical protein